MDILTLNNVTKSFDNGKNFALKEISFSLEEGKICAIVGESGSGKTTLLRLISGLETLDYGSIAIKDTVVSSTSVMRTSLDRNVGMVFQDYALFPHLTVSQNIGYGIKKEVEDKVKEMLQLVDLVGYENRYPSQLSGGEQQRIALARTLAASPKLLLLDEPFSSLDASLRSQLRSEVHAIVKKAGITAIFITHDTIDAIAIADEVIILKEGRLLQKGTIEELNSNPTDSYVTSVFSELKISASTILKALR
ncbi:MAG: ABC transporter ATP-binding protein [Cellulophaga sp.]